MFQITENLSQNTTTIILFERAVKMTGQDLPKFDPSTVITPNITAATPEEIVDAVRDVVAAGKDPLTDKGVQKLMMSKLLVDQVGGFQHRNDVAISRSKLEQYKAHAPALLAQMESDFIKAVETMREQIPLIGHRDLKHALTEIDRVPERVAEGVTAAYRALSKTKTIIDALPYILAAAGAGVPSGGHHALLSYCKPTHDQFREHRLSSMSTTNNHGRPHNVWDLLNDGIDIELATTTEERQARIDRLEQGQQEASRDRRADAAQNTNAKAQARIFGIS